MNLLNSDSKFWPSLSLFAICITYIARCSIAYWTPMNATDWTTLGSIIAIAGVIAGLRLLAPASK